MIVGIVNIVYVATPFGTPKQPAKTLRITVPEDLEYEGVFDEVLDGYAADYELSSVQTTNMGSLFQLEYVLRMKEAGREKAMIDDIRCLNGNLKVVLGRAATGKDTL